MQQAAKVAAAVKKRQAEAKLASVLSQKKWHSHSKNATTSSLAIKPTDLIYDISNSVVNTSEYDGDTKNAILAELFTKKFNSYRAYNLSKKEIFKCEGEFGFAHDFKTFAFWKSLISLQYCNKEEKYEESKQLLIDLVARYKSDAEWAARLLGLFDGQVSKRDEILADMLELVDENRKYRSSVMKIGRVIQMLDEGAQDYLQIVQNFEEAKEVFVTELQRTLAFQDKFYKRDEDSYTKQSKYEGLWSLQVGLSFMLVVTIIFAPRDLRT